MASTDPLTAEKDAASAAGDPPRKGRKRKRPQANRQKQSAAADDDDEVAAMPADQEPELKHVKTEPGSEGVKVNVEPGPVPSPAAHDKVAEKLAGFITVHEVRVVNGKPIDLYYHSSQTTQVFEGVQKGALILMVGGVPVTSDKEIADEIRKAVGPTNVTLFGRPANKLNSETRCLARTFKGRRETNEHSALAPSAVCTQDTVDASVQPEWDAHFDAVAGMRYYRHRTAGQLEWESALEFNVDLQDSNTRRNLFVREGCTLAQRAACNVSARIAENVIRIEGPAAALQDLKLSLIKISLVGGASLGIKKSNKLNKQPNDGKAKALGILRGKLQAASAEERYEDARRIKKEIEAQEQALSPT
eukprot:gene15797-24130_t